MVAYVHTYIRTYIHTYIHTLHTYLPPRNQEMCSVSPLSPHTIHSKLGHRKLKAEMCSPLVTSKCVVCVCVCVCAFSSQCGNVFTSVCESVLGVYLYVYMRVYMCLVKAYICMYVCNVCTYISVCMFSTKQQASWDILHQRVPKTANGFRQ